MDTSEGVVLLGSQVLGYTEREVLAVWDVAPDLRDARQCFTPNSYLGFYDARFATQNYIQFISNTRWAAVVYKGPPCTEKNIFVYYSQCFFSNRTLYYYPDTSYRYVYAEGVFTATPLLLKYPKYYNWNYLPQVLTPEFRIWSFYPIDESSVTLKIVTDRGKFILLNAGAHPDKVEIVQESDKVYRIVFYVDTIFEHGEKVDCYLSLYDIKGNYLKDGLW